MTSINRGELAAFINTHTWAIEKGYLDAMVGALHGGDAQAAAPREHRGLTKAGNVAVLPLYGPIVQRMGPFSAFFGATSTIEFGKALDQLVADDSIKTIVVDTDSPGGTVSGVPELAAKIRAARSIKPITFVANTWAASAAYWLASQGSEIVIVPSGEVGSIGVWSMHVDVSGLQTKAGVKTTLVSAGKYKVEANPYEPLSQEARAAMQRDIDRYYDMFAEDVAKGRRTASRAVKAGYGEGRMIGARLAVELGMADRVATLDVIINRETKRPTPAQLRAEAFRRDHPELYSAAADEMISQHNTEVRIEAAARRRVIKQAEQAVREQQREQLRQLGVL